MIILLRHCGRPCLARDLSEKMSKHEPLRSLLCDPVRKYSFMTQLWYEQGNSLFFAKYLDMHSDRQVRTREQLNGRARSMGTGF